MKNLTKKIVTLLAALVFSLTAIAQNEVVYAPYPQYGFWSNWKVGANAVLTTPIKHNTNTIGIGYSATLEKELNNIWSLELGADAHKVENGTGIYGGLNVGINFSLPNIIYGYDPNSVLDVYLIANAGLGIDRSGVLVDKYGKLYYNAGIGVGVSIPINNHFDITLEDVVYLPGDIGNIFTTPKQYYNSVSIGLEYKFGITDVDKTRIEQMNTVLDKGEAYDSVVTDLSNTVERKDDTIRDYSRTLADITVLNHKTFDTIVVLEKSRDELDSLMAMLDTMRAEQYNYWALPISVEFDFDSYEVKERYKVEALAEVMNDGNEYIVVGFTDTVGTEEYNKELSQKRVDAVYNMLIGFGIPADKMEVRSVGFAEQFGNIDKVNRKVSVYRKL